MGDFDDKKRPSGPIPRITVGSSKQPEVQKPDTMLVERCGDGWIASYRFDPMSGSSGKLKTAYEALEWLRKMEATRGQM